MGSNFNESFFFDLVSFDAFQMVPIHLSRFRTSVFEIEPLAHSSTQLRCPQIQFSVICSNLKETFAAEVWSLLGQSIIPFQPERRLCHILLVSKRGNHSPLYVPSDAPGGAAPRSFLSDGKYFACGPISGGLGSYPRRWSGAWQLPK